MVSLPGRLWCTRYGVAPGGKRIPFAADARRWRALQLPECDLVREGDGSPITDFFAGTAIAAGAVRPDLWTTIDHDKSVLWAQRCTLSTAVTQLDIDIGAKFLFGQISPTHALGGRRSTSKVQTSAGGQSEIIRYYCTCLSLMYQ